MAKTIRPLVNGEAPPPPATTPEDLQAELLRLKAENERLKASRSSGPSPTLKISAKGAVSVYGMGRWPVTLYREQWERLLQMKTEIEDFIQNNDSRLKRKGEVQDEE